MPVGPYDDFDQCVAALTGEVDDPEAVCGWMEQQAADGPNDGFSGAVVTLVPTVDDVARLSVNGGEAASVLHLTLAWLGEPDGDPAPTAPFDLAVARLADVLRTVDVDPIEAEAFAHAVFNPASDERDPATVLLLQADALADIATLVRDTLDDLSDFPVWFPHLTLGYNLPPLDDDAVAARMGPVTFDRIRVSYGPRTIEFDLGGPAMTAATRARKQAATRYRIVAPGGTTTIDTECHTCATAAVDPDAMPAPGATDEVVDGPRWEGILAVENEETGDGRMMEAGAIRWDNLPVPFRWAREDNGQHMGAVVVGRIDEVWREGNNIMGRGVFDAGSDEGIEAARQVGQGLTTGVSVDLDDVDFEIRVDRELFEEGIPEEPELDEDGREIVIGVDAHEEVMVTLDARLRAATMVATPAFVGARIALIEETPVEPEADAVAASGARVLTAGAAAVGTRPPSQWFDNPGLSAPTPITVTDDGRIYGHLAPWGTCHTGYSHECVTAPHSESGYAYFRTGTVRTSDGKDVPAGRITLDTLHAGRRLSATDTAAHYEHTGMAVADVAAGEDEHGIWVAGSVRPGLSDEQLRVLRASPLSGDWRRIGGRLELVAALAVNSGGFPVARGLVASGSVQSLQVPGIEPAATRQRNAADDRILARMIARERAAEERRAAEAEASRRKVLVASAAADVRRSRR